VHFSAVNIGGQGVCVCGCEGARVREH